MPLRDKLRCLRELGKVTGGRVAAQMDRGRVLGFVTERGSSASHAAILARTMGIPAVAGAAGESWTP